MITNELLEYVKGEHLRGVPLESIKVILLENGWLTADIEEAFNALYSPAAAPKAFSMPTQTPLTSNINIGDKPIEEIKAKPIVESKPIEIKPELISEIKIEPISDNTFESIAEIKPEPVAQFKPEPIVETKPEPVFVNKFEPLIINPNPTVNKTINPTVNLTNPIVNQTINPNPVINPVINPVVNPITHHDIETNPSNVATPIGAFSVGDSFNSANFPTQTDVKGNIVNPYLMLEVPKHKSNLKKILFAIFLVLVVLGSAAATYAYYNGYFVSLSNVSTKAFGLVHDANSLSYDATVSVDTSGINKDVLASLPANIFSSNILSITAKGAYDKSDPNNFKFNHELNLNFGLLNTTIDSKILNGTLFAEVTKIPTISFLGDLSNFENKWVAIPLSGANSAVPGVTNIAGVDPSILSNLTQAQKDKFIQITENAHFIKITKRLPMETITNGPAYHFTFAPDFDGIRVYLQNVKDYINSVGKDNSMLSSFDPVSRYDESTAYIKSFTGEAWIGKNDNLPQKLVINESNFVNSKKPENGFITTNIVVIFRDWNKHLNVVAPTDSLTFEQLVSQFTAQAQIKATDASINSNVNNLATSAGMYYTDNTKGNGSYKGLCSTKEVKDAISQIKSTSNNASQLVCLSTKTRYIISAKLSDNTFACADSTGTIKNIPNKPVGFVCE